MKSYKFTIEGRVQKVYYRKTVCENAQKENLSGYVKNLRDGTVAAYVTTDNVERFIEILKQGSPSSNVTNITQSEFDGTFEGKFEVKR